MESAKAKAFISKVMEKKKKMGILKKNPKQAIAIALSEARRKGFDIPKKPKSTS